MFLSEVQEATTVNIDWNDLINILVEWCMTTGVKLVVGLIVLLIICKIANVLTKKLYKKLQKKGADETISRVGTQALRVVIKAFALIIFVSYIGVETASLTALIASLGVGFSLALNGVLSNFAGGVIIILMRPFKIGDFITANGESGTVEDIHMYYTVIVTPDNKVVHVPNGSLSTNVIVNVSSKESRRVDIVMNISYDADYEKARSLILGVIDRNDDIYKTPEPYVAVGEYGASSVDLNVRVWASNNNYWVIRRYLMEEIKKSFDAEGIEIPFNQLDVNIKK